MMMKNVLSRNPVYVLTVCLWLVMCYLAWNFGYDIGRTSVDRRWDHGRRIADGDDEHIVDHRHRHQNDKKNVSPGNAERFPRPCPRGGAVEDGRQIVIFNSVPRCGGRTILSVAFALTRSTPRPLAAVNLAFNYSLGPSRGGESAALSSINRAVVSAEPPGFIYTNIRFAGPPAAAASPERTPLLIGLVRDPLQRLASSFYSERFGDRLRAENPAVDGGRPLREERLHVNQTFADCVRTGMAECLGGRTKGALIRQFCGYHSDCETASQAALLRAKGNVRAHYLVVGVLEEVEDFVKVVEKLLPVAFKGASEILESDESVRSVVADSQSVGGGRLQTISDATRSVLRSHLALDFDFYYFVQWRFMKQKEECGL